MNKKKNNSSFKKNTILLAIGNILTKGLLFVMIPFFSRWLSTEDYGFFDLFCTYVSLLIPIITLATGEAMFRYSIQKDTNKEARKSYITNCLFIVCLNCLTVVAILLGAKFLFNWKLAIPFIFLLVGEVFNNFFQSYLRALKKLNIYSFFSAFTVIIISIFTTIFIRKMNMGLEGIIYGYALGYITGNICIALYTKINNYISIKSISKKQIKSLIKYSYPLIPNSISWWIVNVSDRFIINVVLGVAANGIYAIANKIPAICSAIFSVFNISWQQEATESVESGNMEAAKKYFNNIYNSMTKLLISICIVILSCNYILFNFIFDKRYYDAHLYSPILITAIIFMLLSQFYGGIQISLKRPKENGITTVVGAISNILINVLTIKFLGLYAAAISTLLSYIIVDLYRKYKLKKTVSFSLAKYNIIMIAIYTYFFITSYLIRFTILSIVNMILSTVSFIYINRSYLNKLSRKIIRR